MSFCLNPKAEPYYASALFHFTGLLNRLTEAEAQGYEHGAIEALLRKEGNESLRLALQGYFDQRGREEIRLDAVIGEDGHCRSHCRNDCQRQLETVFGGVTLSRLGYEGRGLSRIYPLDAALNLPLDRYSHGLRNDAAGEMANVSFDSSVEEVKRAGGGEIPKRQIREMAVDLVQDFEAFYDQPMDVRTELGEAANETPPILVISADGKGVVMHTQDLREETRRAAERREMTRRGRKRRHAPSVREKGDRRRMATVATVYEIGPHQRSAEQVLGLEKGSNDPRPRPVRKRIWAGIREALGGVVEQAFDEALLRDPEQKRPWVVLIDGSEELIRQVEMAASLCQTEVTIIQDFVHVQEYIWGAAHALYPEDGQAPVRERWVIDRERQLLRGKAQDVATGLRRAATRQKLEKPEALPVHKAADYIEKNLARMRYDQALEQGFPIATGVIEGACRHLVKDRMELTGARWRLNSAEAILRLRALKVSGDLERYLRFHHQQAQQRNYKLTLVPRELRLAA